MEITNAKLRYEKDDAILEMTQVVQARDKTA